MNQLKFADLRRVNRIRVPLFKNPKGEHLHTGEDWSLNDWMAGVSGEVGETVQALLNMLSVVAASGKIANTLKKVRRDDFALEEAEVRKQLAHEFADVVIYLDILADQCGIDLAEAVQEKFNQKSRATNTHVYLESGDPIRS